MTPDPGYLKQIAGCTFIYQALPGVLSRHGTCSIYVELITGPQLGADNHTEPSRCLLHDFLS